MPIDTRPSSPIVKLFEFNRWANLELIDLCTALDEQQLQTTADGVFGPIQPTLTHIIRSEGGYLTRLTNTNPFPAGIDWITLSVAELRGYAEQTGDRLVEIADKIDPDIHFDVIEDGMRYRSFYWTVLLQAAHHAIEHRTQLKVLLTTLGVPHPDLDVWDFTSTLRSA